MKLYTVYYRYEDGHSLASLAERAILVRDGFSWPALAFGPVWLAWRRMWIVLAFYIAVMLVIAAAARLFGVPEGAVLVMTGAVNLLLALEGNGLYCWSLERRRYRERAVVAGASLAEAEERFFSGRAALGHDMATGPLEP